MVAPDPCQCPITSLVSALGFVYQAPQADLILPVGISFYTFVTLSYTLDVYRRKAAPVQSFLDFALFVTFSPTWWPVPSCAPTN